MNGRIPKSPEPWPETAEFWNQANSNRLVLMRCRTTGKPYFFPRPHSPFTGGNDTEWIDASGRGTIYSFSVLPRSEPKYCIAYITLEEGPTILSNVLMEDLGTVRIGQAVRVSFVASENGQLVPMFVAD